MSLPKPKMTADAFLAWAMEQPPGRRHELDAGEVVAMAPERAAHARVKHRVARCLEDGIAGAGLPCEVFPDGMAVRIDDATVYEPDALVRCGEPLADDAVDLDDPVIVVEVLSPSTRARDSGAKLEGYFKLKTLRHYLIVKTDTRAVIHHAREDGGRIRTSIVTGGELRLDPPGVEVGLEAIFT
ncbi:MAG: Uma2 family endonuclease [Geminicoccaceae bacterium]|nr:Uma2 family endonuclease [Geminicoccaceae bacterium]